MKGKGWEKERNGEIRSGKLARARERGERNTEREKGRARGRSSGSSEARVAGEGRGFESGVAFRGARSALSSREPGERERTCVPARRKRVIFSHPRLLPSWYSRHLFPPKEKIATKSRKTPAVSIPFTCFFPSASPILAPP